MTAGYTRAYQSWQTVSPDTRTYQSIEILSPDTRTYQSREILSPIHAHISPDRLCHRIQVLPAQEYSVTGYKYIYHADQLGSVSGETTFSERFINHDVFTLFTCLYLEHTPKDIFLYTALLMRFDIFTLQNNYRSDDKMKHVSLELILVRLFKCDYIIEVFFALNNIPLSWTVHPVMEHHKGLFL